ncbi:MAG: FAD-dependent oxidoreductase [Candidatus Poribacteria bacterium]|nr:FAD-dependent oxidoreductase [Candidatus Poribacteria bacterium]
MKASIRVVVIGGGVIGAAAALELARGGRFEVSVIERLPQIAAGSTAASTAVIRQFYRSGESIKLARSGLHVWRDWRGWLGRFAPAPPLAEFCGAGALWIFPETSRAKEMPHIQECMRLGVQLELLTQERMRERFPAFHFLDEPRVFGILETEAGYVDMPSLAARNMMGAALATGNARLYLNAQAVDFPDNGVVIDQNGERKTIQADAVLNAAGPHSYLVNALAGCPLPLTTAPNRQQFIDARETAALARHPDTPLCVDLLNGFYMKPDSRRFRVGAILPKDERDFAPDPDRFDARLSDAFAEEKTRALRRRMPEARLEEAGGGAALYDVTVADWKPVIDKMDREGYFAAVGTSGAWFKGAPVIGRLTERLMSANLLGGIDTDAAPLTVPLPYTGQELDMRAFSRRRSPGPEGGVIG